jgi:hypothetical protein
MHLLRLAMEKQRWDLAAHTIVLVTVRALNRGELDAGKSRRKKYHKTQSKP